MSQADTLEEFVKAFQGGHFGLKIGDNIFPATIGAGAGATSKDSLPLRYMIGPSGTTKAHQIRWTTDRNQIVRSYPDLGCVKAGPTVGYLRTRPAKQYRKGYVPANAELFIPNHSEIRQIFPRFNINSGSKELVWQIFNREYWHPLEAVRMLDAGEGVGYPLSKNFGLYSRSTAENPIILNRNRDVGVYKEGKFCLFKAFALLKEQFTRETNSECELV